LSTITHASLIEEEVIKNRLSECLYDLQNIDWKKAKIFVLFNHIYFIYYQDIETTNFCIRNQNFDQSLTGLAD